MNRQSASSRQQQASTHDESTRPLRRTPETHDPANSPTVQGLRQMQERLREFQTRVQEQLADLDAEITQMISVARDELGQPPPARTRARQQPVPEVPPEPEADLPPPPAPRPVTASRPRMEAPARPRVEPPPPPPTQERQIGLETSILNVNDLPRRPRRKQAVGVSVPAPQEAERAKMAMFGLHQAVESLMGNPQIPGTDVNVDTTMRREVLNLSQQLMRNFLELHNDNKEQVARRWQEARQAGDPKANPIDFWGPEEMETYADFCVNRFIHEFLDPIEVAISQNQADDYQTLIDHLAHTMRLERIRVQPMSTLYSPLHHVSELGEEDQPPTGSIVEDVIHSGYVVAGSNEVVRKAIVRVMEPAEDQSPGLTLDDSDGADPDLAFDSMELQHPNPDRLPAPEIALKCERRVAKLESAVGRLLESQRLPRTGAPLNPVIADLVREYTIWLRDKFDELHNENLDAARSRYAAMPNEGHEQALRIAWHSELIDKYRQFLRKTSVEHFLDRLEAKIRASGLVDHMDLVPHFAREMNLGRLHIEPRITIYDPERHDIHGETNVTWQEELARSRVWEVIRPGYTDLENGKIARKALVRLRLPKEQYNPTAQHEVDGRMAFDLDLS